MRISSESFSGVVITKREPEYTEEARHAQVSGVVVLSAVISPDGVPSNLAVVRTLGYGLDERAISSVQDWRFAPAKKEGKPVAVLANIEVNFRLMTQPPRALPEWGEIKTAEEAYRRAMSLVRSRRMDEAVTMLGKAINLKSGLAYLYAARGRIQYDLKHYAQAISDFDQALRIGPPKPQWFDMRGLAYSYSGQHSLAVEDYTRAIALNPEGSPLPYNNRGWAYRELGQAEKAIKDFDKCLELAPDYLKAFENRGEAYAQMKNYDHAISDYTAAMQLQATAWQYRRRAEAKKASGDAAGAEEDLRTAAAIEGASPVNKP